MKGIEGRILHIGIDLLLLAVALLPVGVLIRLAVLGGGCCIFTGVCLLQMFEDRARKDERKKLLGEEKPVMELKRKAL